VQIPHRALLRVARVGAAHTRRVGGHGAQLLCDRLGLLAQTDGVAIRFGHLAPVEPGHLGYRGEQHLRLGENAEPNSLEKAEQPLAIGDRDAVIALHERLGALQRFGVAALLEFLAQLAVGSAVAPAEALHRALGLRFEVGLAAIQMVEAARGLARQLDVRHLVLTDRHVRGTVHEYVRALQQRVTEEPVGGEILLFQLFLLVLVARHALEPAERRDHREQQVQLGVLGNVRLHEERGNAGIQAGGQPVDQHFADVFLQARGVLVAGREHVPVGDEEETFVLILQLDPVAQRPMPVAEVQRAGGTHAGKDAPRRRGGTHVRAMAE